MKQLYLEEFSIFRDVDIYIFLFFGLMFCPFFKSLFGFSSFSSFFISIEFIILMLLILLIL